MDIPSFIDNFYVYGKLGRLDEDCYIGLVI